MILLAGMTGVARAEEASDEQEEAPPELVGFELGQFFLKDYRPVEAAKSKLSFTLHAAVYDNRAEGFGELIERRDKRIRNQVITSARLAEPTEFEDPELGLFRRRMLLRLRRAMPELPIENIYFSDFHYTLE